MKNIFRVLMVSLSLLLLTGIKGEARELAPPNVELQGNAEGIVFIPGNEQFLKFHGMLPGDRIKRRLILTNEYTDSYEIFIRAERVSEREEYDLLEKLNMRIKYEDDTLHEGDATGAKSIKEDVSLGVIKPGESRELFAEVELDGASTGNEYKNKYGEVKWIFTAVRIPSENENIGGQPSEDNTQNNNNSNNNNLNNNGTNNNSSNNNSSTTPPKTGDSGILKYLILIITGIIAFKVINRKGSRA